ncbi:MAG: hypothetical protein M3P34_00400 [Actinomycetota bacterium]|nr:hypothetical protein [Actinomycetota bacterium]
MDAYNRLLVGNLMVIVGFLILRSRQERRLLRALIVGLAIAVSTIGAIVALDGLAKLTVG